jgi:hypothetical protein
MNRPFLALACMAVMTAACGDPGEPGPADPLSGTWDFATTLDTVVWEGTDLSAETRAKLSGTFTVPATRASVSGFEDLSGAIQGWFCDPSSYRCATLVPIGYSYDDGRWVLGSTTIIELHRSDTYEYYDHAVYLFASVVTADSVTGRVDWSERAGAHVTTHQGKFVARKRK